LERQSNQKIALRDQTRPPRAVVVVVLVGGDFGVMSTTSLVAYSLQTSNSWYAQSLYARASPNVQASLRDDDGDTVVAFRLFKNYNVYHQSCPAIAQSAQKVESNSRSCTMKNNRSSQVECVRFHGEADYVKKDSMHSCLRLRIY
jgi:hypothetical protein